MLDEHDAADSKTNWAPTTASSAVVLVGTLGGVAALSAAVGVVKGTIAAATGAVCLAAALWLLTWNEWRVPATLAASLLLVPAGAGIAAGVGYESLVAFALAFPASSPTRVVGESLRILGVMAVLVGSTVAVSGAAASVRGVATSWTVSKLLDTVIRVTILPMGLSLALGGHALLTNFDVGLAGMVGDAVRTATDWVLAPSGDGTHLLSFGLLAAAAAFAGYRMLRDLPTEELAGEATVGDVRVADLAASLQLGFSRLVAISALVLPLAFLAETTVPDRTVEEALPGLVWTLLVALTGSAALRSLLWWVVLVAAALVAVAALVRRSSRASTAELLVGYAPFLAGATVVAGVRVLHRPLLDALVGFVAGRLDAPLAGQFRTLSEGVVTFYGGETVVLGLTSTVLLLAVGGVFALRIAFALGFVTDRVAGPALAGGGLFVAAAFVGTVSAPTWLVFGSLVAALVVWDAGEFATTLGAEVGRRAPTRRVELLHGLGALAVGVCGALAAGALASGLPAGWGATGELSVALLAAVAGVVLLVTAMR
ncbi:hypothetical protein M0R88_14485 [Halorussus gelatinilyticus]|uniref:Uncharacterized protein n=1 Tax=Halorussus gelatinilyticus TaxID=2937524 RepID=A0A8U0IG54_9EURY|nr:hypothetical protein [Halorussus gelatinilyticus]UPV99714.1 hypothetical protein M0R88_14485 [Halorussus gelatinilyticus]